MKATVDAEERSKHDRVAEAVERSLRRIGRDVLQGTALEGCLKLWREFTEGTDLSRTRKPETWAAALVYTYERLRLGWVSQEEIARAFAVSSVTVGQKYRQIAEALELVVLDARYLPEAMRAQIQRDHGPWPEDLPLWEVPAPGPWNWRRPPIESVDAWETWFEARERNPWRRAQEWTYEGWELLGDPEEAERCFRAALQLDPTLADAHNGLGRVAEAYGDLEEAEGHYHTAYQRAREALGTESPRAFHWWLDLDTRPYMRARQGLGWIYWLTERYREAIAEYEALLDLNPNDNQGVRYLIGPLYQLAGDLEGALRAYQEYERDYPDDMGDPHHLFCWGLALYEAAQRQEAVAKWREACFQNVYIVPLLLDEELPDEDIWLFTNRQWPDYAEEYLALYGELWERSPDALACLEQLWHDPESREDLEHWLEIGQRLEQLRSERANNGGSGARAEWLTLIETRREIEERGPSEALLKRVLDG